MSFDSDDKTNLSLAINLNSFDLLDQPWLEMKSTISGKLTLAS